MRRIVLIGFALLLCSFYAVAQDYPKAEVFGGFSFIHADTEGVTPASVGLPTGSSIKTWYPGWEVAGQYNLTHLLGIKADFNGNYGQPVSVPGTAGLPSARSYTFLFGPVVSFRGDRFTPFVHAGFGGNHIGVDASATAGNPAGSETAFAMAFGGGLDVKVSRHFAVRLGQFAYVFTKHCGNLFGTGCILGGAGEPADHQNNFHFATGIVIH